MQRLKCSDFRCRNNYHSHCVRDILKITEIGYCGSFEEKHQGNQDHARYEYEFACDMDLCTEKDLHHVICRNGQCVHNENLECDCDDLRFEKNTCGAKCLNDHYSEKSEEK